MEDTTEPSYEQSQAFTLQELVDFALCTPEVGAVNFNILRILLHDLLRKLNLDNSFADVNDVETNQIDNFKYYIQGAGTQSPMPGVLRWPQQGGGGHMTTNGFVYNKANNTTPYGSGGETLTLRKKDQQQLQPGHSGQQPPPQKLPFGQGPGQQVQHLGQPGQQLQQPQQYPGQSGQPQSQNPPQRPPQNPGQPGPQQQQYQQQPQQQYGGQQPQQQQQYPGQQPQQRNLGQNAGIQTLNAGQGQPGQPIQTQTPAQNNPSPNPGQGQYTQTAPLPGQGPNPQLGQRQGQQTQPIQNQAQQTQPGPGGRQYPPNGQPQQTSGQYQQSPSPGGQYPPGPGQNPGQPRQAQRQNQYTQLAPPQQFVGGPPSPGQQPQQTQTPSGDPGQANAQNPMRPPAQQDQGQEMGRPRAKSVQWAGPGQNVATQQYPLQQQQQQQQPDMSPYNVAIRAPPPPPPPQKTNAGQQTFPDAQTQWQGSNQEQGQNTTGLYQPVAVAGQPRSDGIIRHVSQGQGMEPLAAGLTQLSSPQILSNSRSTKKLEEKVARLERHLEALYALPANKDLLETEDAHGMSVNDMWQIIQLNNRIAATEAAIQKMASLIEDLAKQLKAMKKEAKANGLQMDKHGNLTVKCSIAEEAIETLKSELNAYRAQVKGDLELVGRRVGVDFSHRKSIPTFLVDGVTSTHARTGQGQQYPRGRGRLSSERDERWSPETDDGSTSRPGSLSATEPQPSLPLFIQTSGPGLIYGPDGKVKVDSQGKRVEGRQSQYLINEDGSFRVDSEGNLLMVDEPVEIVDKDGNRVLGKDGKPITNKLVQLFRKEDGSPRDTSDGKNIIASKAELIIDPDTGKIKVGPDGRALYSTLGKLALDSVGNPIISPGGQAIYIIPGKPLVGAEGKQLTGMDGRPILIEAPPSEKSPYALKDKNDAPYMNSAGQPLMSNQALVGPNGSPYMTPGPAGHPVQIFTPQGQIQLGRDGFPQLDPSGEPIYSITGPVVQFPQGTPLEGITGQPIHANIGQILTDNEGEPLKGPDGEPLVSRTGEPVYWKVGQILVDDQGTAVIGPDNQLIYSELGTIMLDAEGRPRFDSDGTVVYTNVGQSLLDAKGMPLFPSAGFQATPLGSRAAGAAGRPRGHGGKRQVTITEVPARTVETIPGRSSIPIYSNSVRQSVLNADGITLMGKGGKPISNILGQYLYDLRGHPVMWRNSIPLYSNVGQILMDPKTSSFLRGPDGKILYSNFGQLTFDPETGNPILGPDNLPAYLNHGEGVILADGQPARTMDGKPLVLQSIAQQPGKPIMDHNHEQITDNDGKPILSNQILRDNKGGIVYSKNMKPIPLVGLDASTGKRGQVFLGQNGTPEFDENGDPIYSAYGKTMLDADGLVLRGADKKSLTTNVGQIVWDSEGKPATAPNGDIIYSNLGQIIVDHDGVPVLGEDGKMIYANVAQVMLGEDGKIMFNRDGTPMYSFQLGPILASDGKPKYEYPQNLVDEWTHDKVNQISKGMVAGVDTTNTGVGTPKPPGGVGAWTTANISTYGTDRGSGEGRGSQDDADSQTPGRPTMRDNYQDPNNPYNTGPTEVEVDNSPFIPYPMYPGGIFLNEPGRRLEVDPAARKEAEEQRKLINDELQAQYFELQGMQRQLATDIEDKMEFVYQKLIREVANQQMSTSPYMMVGAGLGKCFGPGICHGHGMPAETAVCQFPAHDENLRLTGASQTVPTALSCPYCRGSGRNQLGICPNCAGTGRGPTATGPLLSSGTPGMSSQCQGKGQVFPCPFQQQQQLQGQRAGGGGKLMGPCAHGLDEYRVCPGPGICTGAAVCPACKNDDLHQLKAPRPESLNKPFEFRGRSGGLSQSGANMGMDRGLIGDADVPVMDILKKECKTLILLPKDLEDLRERVKLEGRIPNVFDEMDILERIHTLWEAVNSLKHNDEALAVRMLKQDTMLKKFPRQAVMEKIQQIPVENLDAIASASFDQPIMIPSDSVIRHPTKSFEEISGEEEETYDLFPPGKISRRLESESSTKNLSYGGGTRSKPKNQKGAGARLADDDVQTIFNNLSNLLVESAAQKERLEGVSETLKNMETSMVTKNMLIDAMSDKADKGHVNTKVSYDEFGNSMDELTSRMQNLLIEVYQKNENWKSITDHLGEELTAKLDKIELAPVRAYFKSHLKTLEERVAHLTQQFEEPDPAGTRKKLLRDYNCLSCDRHAHISGLTNASQLPEFGPILAGHGTASQRAYDLHRIRNQKQCRYDNTGRDCRDVNYVPKDLCQAARGDDGSTSVNQNDLLQMVNRYVGGSHTTVSTGNRIAALNKKYGKSGPGPGDGDAAGLPPVGQQQGQSQRNSRFPSQAQSALGNRSKGQSQSQLPPIISKEQQQIIDQFYDE